MRKPVLTLAAVALCFVGSAQSIRPVEKESERQAPFQDEKNHDIKRFLSHKHQQASPENIIFSEDFASGIPASWTNSGTAAGVPDPDAVWEYRGATGAYPATVGSRGAYGSAVFTINSPTAANGFVIFDSDFLDNAGTAGNFGGGIAPSPHYSTLVSPVIDLSGESNVVLTFNQYYRRFLGPGGTTTPSSYVDISTDGGATWGTTLTLNSGVGINGSTALNDQQILNITSVVAGVAQARLRFRFDGDYYFWMLDDIQLTGLQNYDLDFVALDGWSDIDWIVGDGSKMGINTRAQAQDWTFLSSIFNRGSQALDNVQLEVGIIKDNAPYTSLFSPVYASLAPGDTLPYIFLNTLGDQFIPSEAGTYQFYYQINSDSVTLNSDTIYTFTTINLMSLDYNYWYNSLGTANFGGDSSAMAVRIDFEANDTLNAVDVGLGTGTQGGARLIVEVYDSSAFTGYVTGFDKSARLDSAGPYIIDPTNAFQGNITLPLSQSLYLGENNRSVYLVIWMFTNGGASQVAIRNDQTVDAVIPTSMMHFPGQQWYTGYTNSRSFESPWIRAVTSGGTCNLDYNPIATTPGNYQVNLAWDATGASLYNVRFRLVGDSTWTQVNSTTNSRTIRPIAPGSYEYFISEAGGANPSCVGNFTIDCEDFNFSSNVFQIVDATGGKVNVFGITGGRRTWDFGIYDGVDTTWVNNRFSNRFINLDAGTYYFMVRDNYGCYSSQIDTVVIDPLPSYVPTLTSVQNLGGGSLVPNWTVPDSSQVNAFQVRVKDMTGGGVGTLYQTYIANGGGATNFTVTGLPPARYRIDVRARPNNGTFADGVYSNYMERVVAAPSAKGEDNSADMDASWTIAVYPNPTSSTLNVIAPMGSELTLLDINGRVITSRWVDSIEEQFEMSSLSEGVYMLRVISDQGVTTQRIIKQ